MRLAWDRQVRVAQSRIRLLDWVIPIEKVGFL